MWFGINQIFSSLGDVLILAIFSLIIGPGLSLFQCFGSVVYHYLEAHREIMSSGNFLLSIFYVLHFPS